MVLISQLHKGIFCIVITQFICLLTLNGQMTNAHPFDYRGLMGLVDDDGNILVEPKYKWIQRFDWPETKYALFQDGERKGVMATNGRVALAPQLTEPNIFYSFATHYDDKDKLLGLHVVDLDRGVEILTDDSLRLWDVIQSTPPILWLADIPGKRNYLYDENGKLITSCGSGLFQIVVPDKKCPIFSCAPDKNLKYQSRYFDCHGTHIPDIEFEQKYPEYVGYRGLVSEANHMLLLTKGGNPISHSKEFPKQERIKTYKGSTPHQLAAIIRQKWPDVIILEIVETSNSAAAIVINSTGKTGLINDIGEYLLPHLYTSISIKDAWLLVRQNAKVGLITIDGVEKFPVQFRSVECFFNLYQHTPYTFSVTTHTGYTGYATLDGKIFLPTSALEK